MPVMPGDSGGLEIEDTGVDTTLRVSAPSSVPLLDVPLTEATVVEVKDVVLDHADHNCDEDDDADADVDAALVDVSAAAIATVLEVQVVSLPYCRRWIWCGRWVACVIMAREANVAVYKAAFSCISRGRLDWSVSFYVF
jgi:hypothetical protein